MNRYIYHIISETEWEHAKEAGIYIPESIRAEGFIHFSTKEQVLRTAKLFYSGRADLLLLSLDTEQAPPIVKYESTMGGEELFPHYYGALPVKLVTSAHPFPIDSSGNFTLPADVPVD